MLLEVRLYYLQLSLLWKTELGLTYLYCSKPFQAYFMQIDSTMNKLTTVSTCHVVLVILLVFLIPCAMRHDCGLPDIFPFQLREYIDDTEDYINIQVEK